MDHRDIVATSSSLKMNILSIIDELNNYPVDQLLSERHNKINHMVSSKNNLLENHCLNFLGCHRKLILAYSGGIDSSFYLNVF